MNGKEIFSRISKGQMPDRIPFVPTIYEHSARVIGKTPSEVAQTEDLIVEGQLACYETYKHDLIAVGLDIYNVECEALGGRLHYHSNNDLPSIEEVLISSPEDLLALKIPDPESSGRMPLFLKAAERINKAVGEEVPVSGTVVGPFTLAAILRGFEDFIVDLMTEPEFTVQLMEFCKKVALNYASSFIKRGVGIAINESWIAPPLLSPALYREYVLPLEKNMIDEIKKMGQNSVSLISGGNTTSIAECMAKTGTSLLMADYNTDQKFFKELCRKNGISLRASIESKMVEMSTEEELRAACSQVIDTCRDYERFIFGCGVVSFNTSPEQVLKLRRIVRELDNRGRFTIFQNGFC